jgi:uncharacterized protein YndB with AHSA1/START domain
MGTSRPPQPPVENITVSIARPAPVVWDLISDLERLTEWRGHLRDVRWVDEPRQLGSTFEGLSSFALWRNIRLVCRVTEWEPDRYYRYEVIDGPIRADALWGVRPDETGTCFFSAGNIVGYTFSTRALRPIARPLFIHETRREMNRVKTILESEPPSPGRRHHT